MQDRYTENLREFLSGNNKKAKVFFAKHGYELESAYCKLVDDDLKSAKQKFFKLKNFDLRADFGYKLVNILQAPTESILDVNYASMPKFFQLRNFLETDLNILIMHHKGDYVQKLCRYSNVFANINSEAYKYFSRAFFFNNYIDFALEFALKAKNYFYNDAELHYHLALIMLSRNDKMNAVNYCKSCLNIANNYYPAQHLLNILTTT